MPPIYVKGGVWTNVEDEILKAAVSKYGLNQWSRVSSLLVRKSAKQAKARWNEYLNPSVNKLEWTREEDEKLLRLAKLVPNQWRSIAPIMGRTATHCVERYQHLLDEASGLLSVKSHAEDGEDDEYGLMGAGIESMPSKASTVGDLNINPESKPAKPDDEGINEEEREMLSEAKARLANTQGKKAKRKARERMLEETKRISQLQKRRELKAAGIKVSLESKNKKKRKEFDYNADIPHEVVPQTGLYDTNEELEENLKEQRKFKRGVQQDGLRQEKKRKRDRDPAKKADSGVSLEAEAQIVIKRPKLALSAVGTQDLNADAGIDERILSATVDLRTRELEKSSLIHHESSEPLVGGVQATSSVKAQGKQMKSKSKSKPKIPQIQMLLLSLPQAQNNAEIIMSEVIEDKPKTTLVAAKDVLLKRPEQVVPTGTQVVKRGLPIPNPSTLDCLVSRKGPVDDLIWREVELLVASDYKNHKDQSYEADSVEVIGGHELEEIEARITMELADNKFAVSRIHVRNHSLAETFEVAEEIIEQLHVFSNRGADVEGEIIENTEYDEYSSRVQELHESIQDLHRESCELNSKIRLYEGLQKEEETAIQKRTERLQAAVDRIVKAERDASVRLYERRKQSIK